LAERGDTTLLIHSSGASSLLRFAGDFKEPAISRLSGVLLFSHPLPRSDTFLFVTATNDKYELYNYSPDQTAIAKCRIPKPEAIAVNTDGNQCLIRDDGGIVRLYSSTNGAWTFDRTFESPGISDATRFDFTGDNQHILLSNNKGITMVSLRTGVPHFFIPSAGTPPIYSVTRKRPFTSSPPLTSPDNQWLINPESNFELWPIDLCRSRTSSLSRQFSDRERSLFSIQSDP
jgi:hypothetical protein